MLATIMLVAGAVGPAAMAADASAAAPAPATAPQAWPWLDARRSADERARLAVGAMTLDEKIGLLHGSIALPHTGSDGVAFKVPDAAIPSAGFIPGLARLGIPSLWETDASVGVANPGGIRPGDVATALPASIALAATFDPSLAYAAGALVGGEAHAKGFNVLLGGGMNLTRDPRNGRNFEYLGEDPWLSGAMAAQEVLGTQSQHVISTLKHFALNANEINRTSLDARIDKESLRESDLLAFEIAVKGGHPGSIMCGYNLVNGAYDCGNRWLLVDVLKHDWGYPGWVMSDWGAVHDVAYAANGLDQESGAQIDKSVYFDGALERAVQRGAISTTRIDDMVRRILRSMFAIGIVDHPPVRETIDYAAHAQVALDIAHKGMVLLKNDGDFLPLSASSRRIAIIGGLANLGVLSGGGSAQVLPSNGPAIHVPTDGAIYDPSSPLEAIQRAAPKSVVSFDNGEFPARAAALAAGADVAVVFVTRFEREGGDIPDISLPRGQDSLIEAVSRANPHTIVVLETGNPVAMPWLDEVRGVLAAWYPGQEGGQAIADVLFGAVNPSGRLPITFPRQLADFVRPTLPNLGAKPDDAVHVDYTEGADVGYRWYSGHGIAPLFAFGYGLSYTSFEYGALKVTGGKQLSVQFQVQNTGKIKGADVAQVYLTSAAGQPVLRLVGFQRVELEPGEKRTISLTADPRLLGRFDEATGRWGVKHGVYRVSLGKSAGELVMGGEAEIAAYNEK